LPHELLDPRYTFEVGRYDTIAEAGPENYAGLATTKPEYRAGLWNRLLGERGITEFVDVGPGFGMLEEVAQDINWLALDLSLGFLTRLKDRWPERVCIRALAERLPLATGSVPCLVADSVFQSVVDRESFLCEAARVCEPGGLFLFSVAYGWNYLRRPQQGFDVIYPDERAVLRRYLDELDFEVKFSWINIAEERRAENQDDGDYVYIECKKASLS
jgi:SAM-dependent methyltransferase